MSADAVPYSTLGRNATSRLVRAGLLTGVVDALWAIVLQVFIYQRGDAVVIPLLVHRFPTITIRWFIQLAGHFPFVGVPIVASIGSGSR